MENNTEIRMSNNPKLLSNPLIANIDLSGIYDCNPNPMPGTNFWLIRSDITYDIYGMIEIRDNEN